MSAKPESRAAQSRSAGAVLNSLLRSPKTRAGLIAAVSGKLISRNFVYGWLTEQVRTGLVAELKSTETVMYQNANCVIAERPQAGLYPEWLEPRCLPFTVTRRAFFDGRAVGSARKRVVA